MKKLACLFAMVCGLGFGKAQTVCNKTYIADRPVMLFGSVLYEDSGFIVSGVTDGTTAGLAKAMLGRINLNGDLAKYTIIVDSNPNYYGLFSNALIKTSDSKIAFSGIAYDSLGCLLFGIGNSNFDSVTVFKYNSPGTSTYNGACLLQDGGNYFIAGIRLDSLSYNADVLLTKIDSAGNRMWEKYYHKYNYDKAVSIIKLSNGNLMLGAARIDINDFTETEKSNTWLLEVDTGGRIIRQWFDPNDSTYMAEGLKQTQDGGFIYGAQKKLEEVGGSVWSTATIVKMNSNFSKQWTFQGGHPGELTSFTDIEELPDGSFVACGKSNYRSGWIIKLDTSGGVIWSREYVGIPDTGSENYLTDIDVLPDGSLIAVGQCQFLGHTPPQVGWFLKLDNNGCEIENCLVGIGDKPETMDIRQLKVYPNPATDMVRFDYNWVEWEKVSGCRLQVAGLDGRVVLEQAVPKYSTRQDVSVKKLAAGVYTVSLSDNATSGAKAIAVCKLVKE